MWIAPNMVTLLGFMWIVANVLLIVVFMPDLLGPVSTKKYGRMAFWTINTNKFSGPMVVVLQFRSWHVDVSIKIGQLRWYGR